MKNHNDADKDGVNDVAIEPLIASAIHKGTFSPTAHARQANAQHLANTETTQASPLHAGQPPAAQQLSKENQPDALKTVSDLTCDCIEILNPTPLETHQYFLSQGYRCVTSVTSDYRLNRPALKETYSWDEQLILSVWNCLQVLEDSAASSALHCVLLQWLKKKLDFRPKSV